MSTNRVNPRAGWATQATKKKGLCRYCGLDVKRFSKHKKTFCSDACVHEWKLRSNPAYAREQVWKRDKGVCAHCNVNTEKLHAEYRSFINQFQGEDRKHAASLFWTAKQIMPIPGNRVSWWDMDHTVEVVNGGGECGLDNLQTLCYTCHKKKTSKLMKKTV